jgi:hypothetical protein
MLDVVMDIDKLPDLANVEYIDEYSFLPKNNVESFRMG